MTKKAKGWQYKTYIKNTMPTNWDNFVFKLENTPFWTEVEEDNSLLKTAWNGLVDNWDYDDPHFKRYWMDQLLDLCATFMWLRLTNGDYSRKSEAYANAEVAKVLKGFA